MAASGGPDAVGHTWEDEASGCDSSLPAFGPGAVTLTGVRATQGPFALGFTTEYYGVPVSQAWLSPAGFLAFSSQATDVANQSFPDAANPDHLVAVYWTSITTADITYESSPTSFHVRWAQASPLGAISFHLVVHSDARLRMYWETIPRGLVSTVGYEDDRGSRGVTFLLQGVPVEPGFTTLSNGRSLCIIPPPNLDCSSPVVVSCGSSVPLVLPATATTPATAYECTPNRYAGNEQVIRLDVTEPAAVTVTISNPSLDIIHVPGPPACSEFECLQQVDGVISWPMLYPGSQWLVIDKLAAGGGDAYELTVSCDPIAEALACGGSIAGDTTSGRLLRDAHSCRPGDYSGREVYYRVTHPGGSLLASLTGAPDLDVFILDANDLAACHAGDDVMAAAFGLTPGDYLVAVDGPPGSEGPFTLSLACGPQISCSFEPEVLACDSIVSASTAGGTSSVTRYACSPVDLPGPERAYRVQVPPGTAHLIVELQTDADLVAHVLGSCDEGDCEGGPGRLTCATSPAAGEHVIVVDGASPAGGAYTLSVRCDQGPVFDRWTTCTRARTAGQAPGCGISNPWPTTNATTAAPMWSFDDGAFCVSDAGHVAHPFYLAGDDCTFAMYVVAECGTTMNIPLCDNETASMRVYDVLRGQYMDLTGTSLDPACPWTMSGTRVGWQDCAGTNCAWNENVTTISFDGSPTLCGIFRLEFTNWGGFVWDLFANCSGLNEPGFMIYDNLCEALQSYSPRPELSIVNPVLSGACPSYTLDFELHNTGCTPATGFCVRTWEEPAAGPPDVDLTDEALLCDLSLAPGEIRRFTVPVSLTAATAQAIRLEADADGVVEECSEAPGGSVVACAPELGRRVWRVPTCGGCVVVPAGRVQPTKTCVGGDVVFDATGSLVQPCVQGIEHAWTTLPAPPPPGTTCAGADELECWSDAGSVLRLPALSPPPGQRFVTIHLWTRCTEDPTCVNAAPFPLTVEVHRPPEMGTGSAFDLDPCQGALGLSWDAATFWHDPALGPGTYSVYRAVSTGDLAADCLAALAPANRIATGLAATAYFDSTTVPNERYVYVVEAEDREPINPCSPSGPSRAGAVDRLCLAELAGAPAWDELDDVAPHPGVGSTLRASLGDEEGVFLSWDDVRAVPGRELFRIDRSTDPRFASALVSTPSDVPSLDDRSAPGALYFYKVIVLDSCGNEAAPSFPSLPARDAGCRPLPLSCGLSVSGDTSSCASVLADHSCDPGADASGPDRHHEAWTLAGGEVTLTLSAPGGGLRLVVYDTTLTRCLGASDTAVTLTGVPPASRLVVVVDGAPGTEGPYDLSMTCR